MVEGGVSTKPGLRMSEHSSALSSGVEQRQGLPGGAGQDSALFLKTEVGEHPAQPVKHFLTDVGSPQQRVVVKVYVSPLQTGT